MVFNDSVCLFSKSMRVFLPIIIIIIIIISSLSQSIFHIDSLPPTWTYPTKTLQVFDLNSFPGESAQLDSTVSTRLDTSLMKCIYLFVNFCSILVNLHHGPLLLSNIHWRGGKKIYISLSVAHLIVCRHTGYCIALISILTRTRACSVSAAGSVDFLYRSYPYKIRSDCFQTVWGYNI